MCPFCVISDMFLPPSGATAMLWVPPAGSVTSERGSASASQVSPASTVTDVRPTTLASALKAVNVSLRGQIKADGKDVAHPALPLLSFCPWEGILLPCFSSQHFYVHTACDEISFLYSSLSPSSFVNLLLVQHTRYLT